MQLIGQPWDSFLLKKSSLYRKSRALFRAQKGIALPTLLSSPRSLSSAGLIENQIEYSPLDRELTWTYQDRIQRKDLKHREIVRSFTTNVFHEQNHRILWKHLVKDGFYCPQKRKAAHRFLNLVESLVVILDFALSDQLGLKQGRALYHQGVIYSPGSDFLTRYQPSRREYRNYLQAVLHTVYLRLEGMHPDDIPDAIREVFSQNHRGHVDQAIRRAFLLDDLFVELTNPIWQNRHIKAVMAAFSPPRGKSALVLPDREPSHHAQGYVIAEGWMEKFGL